jgi:cytochrome c oxidase subunit 2
MRHFTPLSLLAALALPCAALATETIHPGGFPSPAGEVSEYVTRLYNEIFIVVAVIGVGVAGAMAYIIWKFRRSRGHAPATFSHSTAVELVWTIIPALICVWLAFISYQGLVKVRTMPDDAVNIEAVAYQFGWDFYYPDASENGVHVTVPDADHDDPAISLPGLPRQTKELVVPTGKPIVMHVTSSDVIHAFFVPAMGVKIDAIPGRVNYVWFEADKAGSYMGQCAELCGAAHAEMFFRVKAVSPAEFAEFMKVRRVAAGLPAEHVEAVSSSAVVSGTLPVNVSTTVAHGVSVTSLQVVSATGAGNAVPSSATALPPAVPAQTNPVTGPVSSTAK